MNIRKRTKNSHLFFDENFVGMTDEFVDNDQLVPVTLATIVLHDQAEYHDRFHHQLPVLWLSDPVKNRFHLQCKLQLAGSHLHQHQQSTISTFTSSFQLSSVKELLQLQTD